MRIVCALVLGILLGVGEARAAFVTVEALNSNLEFGLSWPYHTFYDVSLGVCVEGEDCKRDWFNDDILLVADGGPLVQQTISYDRWGEVVSTYRYEGGTFTMALNLSGPQGRASGSYTAPILSLSVTAPDSTDRSLSMGTVSYILGPGRFDKPLARALGVRPHTGDGTIDSYMLLEPRANGGGDYLSRVRYAEDGGSYIDIAVTPVSEPASLLLGMVCLLAAQRRKQQLASKLPSPPEESL